MNVRTLLLVSLGSLLISGIALAQTLATQPAPPADELQTTVVAVKHHQIGELAEVLVDLVRSVPGDDKVAIIPDAHSNQIILMASAKRTQEILGLIKVLDVSNAATPAGQYLTCRIYMLEVPRKGQTGKPFAVVLQRRTSDPVTSQDMMEAITGPDLQISQLLQSDQLTEDGMPGILIKGLAASNEAVRRMIGKIPDSAIKELKWGDEMFTAAVPVAQLSQLPESLQQHIHKFLGEEVQTVGYWFGNASFPGGVTAPIGPWSLELKTEPARGTGFRAEIQVSQPPELIADVSRVVLSNSLEDKIGKPIIIGYNRESYGTRTMGALVIILEADTQPGGAAVTATPSY